MIYYMIFQICPTYPRGVLVPKTIDDETIIMAAKFRDGGRFPVLSYRHEGKEGKVCFIQIQFIFRKNKHIKIELENNTNAQGYKYP